MKSIRNILHKYMDEARQGVGKSRDWVRGKYDQGRSALGRAFATAVSPVYAAKEAPGHSYKRFGFLGIHTTTDTELMKKVLMSPDKFPGPAFVTKTMEEVAGKAMINVEGEAWGFYHDILSGSFSSKSLNERIVPIIIEECDAMMQRWQGRTGETLDVEKEMLDATGRVISRVVFGDSMNEKDSREIIHLISTTLRDFEEGTHSMLSKAMQAMNAPYSHADFLPTMLLRASGISKDHAAAVPKALVEARQTINALFQPYIDERRKLETQPNDILGALIDARHKDGTPLADSEVLDQLIMLVVTGHETTATALTFTFDEVLKAPGVAAKLRDEFNTVAAENPLSARNRQLSYARDVFQEGVRLHPTVRMIARESRETFEHGDIKVHKDDLILIDLVGLHRREDLFPDANAFKPERFSESSSSKKGYRPFGMGPRACTGAPMARPEGELFLSKVFGKFDFEVEQRLEGETHFFTMRPKGQLLVKAKPRQP